VLSPKPLIALPPAPLPVELARLLRLDPLAELAPDQADAVWAARTGLVNGVIDAAQLLTHCLDYATKLSSRAPLAHRLGKEVMLRALGAPLAEGLRQESRSFHDLGATRDLAEGTSAFRDKRAANFDGD
jgi:enoyl-CoA hydratase/carnithine racemase